MPEPLRGDVWDLDLESFVDCFKPAWQGLPRSPKKNPHHCPKALAPKTLYLVTIKSRRVSGR